MNTTTVTAPHRTTRIIPAWTQDDVPNIGQVYCLVEWENQNPNHGAPHWKRRGSFLHSHPRTNLSGESKWEGWLGTTNDEAHYALGASRVVSVTPWDRQDEWADPQLMRVSLVASR